MTASVTLPNTSQLNCRMSVTLSAFTPSLVTSATIAAFALLASALTGFDERDSSSGAVTLETQMTLVFCLFSSRSAEQMRSLFLLPLRSHNQRLHP